MIVKECYFKVLIVFVGVIVFLVLLFLFVFCDGISSFCLFD